MSATNYQELIQLVKSALKDSDKAQSSLQKWVRMSLSFTAQN